MVISRRKRRDKDVTLKLRIYPVRTDRNRIDSVVLFVLTDSTRIPVICTRVGCYYCYYPSPVEDGLSGSGIPPATRRPCPYRLPLIHYKTLINLTS